MNSLMIYTVAQKLRQLLSSDRRGVTALEYGLIAAVIGAVIVVSVGSLGTNLGTLFNNIGNVLSTKAASI